MYSNLPGIFNDKRLFGKIVQWFGFEDEQYDILIEPKVNDCNKCITKLSKLAKNNPNEMILALFCYASHGMIKDGRQVIILNDCSEKESFYRSFGAEENMRTGARTFSNAYIVSIFACCREIYLVS